MHELILSRMMRISKGTYYSGSWSSTACIFQISLHPCLELNPSSLGAGWPTHQPRASGITVYLAWLGLFIDFTHKLTINPLSLYKRLKERMWGGRGGSKTPFLSQERSTHHFPATCPPDLYCDQSTFKVSNSTFSSLFPCLAVYLALYL